MGIYSSLLTTLFVSILGTSSALANQSDGNNRFISQRSYTNSLSQSHSPITASININTADAKTLLELKGVGLKRAETIISFREKNGPFKSINDLARVKGIGKKTVEKNYNRITV